MGIFRQPPSPFIGGHQPLEQNDLIPIDGTVVPDSPPFGSRSYIETVVGAWVDAGRVTAAAPGGAWLVGAAAFTQTYIPRYRRRIR